MACNLPIITTPVFGIAEQIRPGIKVHPEVACANLTPAQVVVH
jgi:hypothetical protein